MFFSCHKLFLCLYRSFSTCQSYISGSVPESVILPLYKNAFKVRLGQDIAVKMDIAGYCKSVLWQFVVSLDGIKTTKKMRRCEVMNFARVAFELQLDTMIHNADDFLLALFHVGVLLTQTLLLSQRHSKSKGT